MNGEMIPKDTSHGSTMTDEQVNTAMYVLAKVFQEATGYKLVEFCATLEVPHKGSWMWRMLP